MKFFQGTIVALVALFSVSTGFAQFTNNTDYQRCEFTQSQMSNIPVVVGFFEKYAEEKIVKKFFTSADYQKLGRALTDDFVQTMKDAQSYCEWNSYEWSQVRSMDSLKSALVEYVTMIKYLSNFSKKSTGNDMMAQEMERVQGFLLWEILEKLDTDMFVYQDNTVDMTLMMAMDDFQLDMDMKASWKGVSDVLWTTVDKEVMLSMNINALVEGKQVSADIEGKAAIRMVGDILYLKLTDPEVVFDSNTLDAEDRAEIEAMADQIKLISWKWIEVPLEDAGGFGNQEMVVSMIQGYKETLTDLFDEPLMVTYHKEGKRSYGGINPMMCLGTELFGTVWDCLEDIWMTSYEETDGKWFMFMEQNLWTYTMWITDKFSDEKMWDEMQSLNGVPLMTWTQNALVKIELPLDEMWIITYENGYLMVDLAFPDTSYDWETGESTSSTVIFKLVWALETENVNLAGVIRSDEFDMDMKLKAKWNEANAVVEWSFSFVGKDANAPTINFEISAKTSQVPTAPLVVVAPNENEVVSIESLMQ